MNKIEGARWKMGLGERSDVRMGLLATTFWKLSSSISLGKEIGETDGVGGCGYGGSICLDTSTEYPSKDNADLKRRRRTFSQEQWSCYASLYVA
jgi:hypothetical protein